MLKVLVLSPLPEDLIRMLFAEQLDKYKIQANFVTINEPDVQVLKRELADTDVVIGDYTFKVPITAEMVEAMKRVKTWGRWASSSRQRSGQRWPCLTGRSLL